MQIDVGTYIIDLNDLKALDIHGDILLHLPAGLMQKASIIKEKIQAYIDGKVYIHGECAFGSCDIPLATAKAIGVKYIIHVGHLPLSNVSYSNEIHVIFANAVMKVNRLQLRRGLDELIRRLKKDKILRVVMVTTAQHLNLLEDVMTHISRHGIYIKICGGSGRANTPGIVLGCNFSNAICAVGDDNNIDAVVFVGTGRFHPLGILMNTSKVTYALNPLTASIEIFDHTLRERIIRKRFAAIARAMDAKNYGIIVSTKVGQLRTKLAFDLLNKGELYGKKCDLIVTDSIRPEMLDNLDFEAYVNTACPRLSIDDYFRFKRPILTPYEFLIAIGAQEFNTETYKFDEMP